jgi:hypothetical protein
VAVPHRHTSSTCARNTHQQRAQVERMRARVIPRAASLRLLFHLGYSGFKGRGPSPPAN